MNQIRYLMMAWIRTFRPLPSSGRLCARWKTSLRNTFTSSFYSSCQRFWRAHWGHSLCHDWAPRYPASDSSYATVHSAMAAAYITL